MTKKQKASATRRKRAAQNKAGRWNFFIERWW